MAPSTVLQRIDMRRALIPPQWPTLAQREIHLWHLSSTELLHAAAVHDVLRRLLCHYAQLDDIQIERDPQGKPWLSNCPSLQFNISHSGTAALLAFAWEQPLGVDVEQGLRLRAPLAVAQRFFHDDETAQLNALAATYQRTGFLSLWAGKEAILKALGQGLSWGLGRIVLRLDVQGRLCALQEIAGQAHVDWHLVPVDLSVPGHGALAWRGSARKVRVFRIDNCDWA